MSSPLTTLLLISDSDGAVKENVEELIIRLKLFRYMFVQKTIPNGELQSFLDTTFGIEFESDVENTGYNKIVAAFCYVLRQKGGMQSVKIADHSISISTEANFSDEELKVLYGQEEGSHMTVLYQHINQMLKDCKLSININKREIKLTKFE